ncbi:MAG: cob(I)yrinic acid a,c-diamide adenosyltransferase [Bernardetiaceae bacterium]|nr:cob(I)yrinic acid a,c-diamide adenosyltransferase [Bernardetiaceae bacterium]
MKIYTKTGDKGTTALVSGRRISKANLRIDAYGTVDELNVAIGMLRDLDANASRKMVIVEIQDRLFTIGSHLASDPTRKSPVQIPEISEQDVTFLENQIDEMNTHLPPMRKFVLPGGHIAVSQAHTARVICRRAERLCIRLHEQEPVEAIILQYLNRLSDYLFVLSRLITQELNVEEIPWEPRV